MQRRDQAVILDEIHPAVAAAFAFLRQRFPERMLVFGGEFAEIVPLVVFRRFALDINPVRVFVRDALRALHEVDPAVRPGQVRVVDQDDRFAELGFDQAGVHVAEHEILLGLRRTGAEMLERVFVQPAGRAAHRHEVIERVAAVDVHALRDRPQAVRGIEVAVDLFRPRPPPKSLAIVAELDAAEVVQIAGLGMLDFAQEAFPHQVQHHQFDAVVAAVFHHLAMLAGLFGELDEFPAVVEGHRGGHLGRRVLAGSHRGLANGHVPLPGRGGHHEVEFLILAHAFEVGRAVRVARRLGLAGLDDGVLRTLDVAGHDVAYGLHLDAVDPQIIPQMVRAHAAHADEAHADPLDRIDLELRAGFAGGLFIGGAGRAKPGQCGAQADEGPGFEKRTAVLAEMLVAAVVMHGSFPFERRPVPT